MECFSAFILAASIYILHLYHKEKDQPVPRILKKFTMAKISPSLTKVAPCAEDSKKETENPWHYIANTLNVYIGMFAMTIVVVVSFAFVLALLV